MSSKRKSQPSKLLKESQSAIEDGDPDDNSSDMSDSESHIQMHVETGLPCSSPTPEAGRLTTSKKQRLLNSIRSDQDSDSESRDSHKTSNSASSETNTSGATKPRKSMVDVLKRLTKNYNMADCSLDNVLDMRKTSESHEFVLPVHDITVRATDDTELVIVEKSILQMALQGTTLDARERLADIISQLEAVRNQLVSNGRESSKVSKANCFV